MSGTSPNRFSAAYPAGTRIRLLSVGDQPRDPDMPQVVLSVGDEGTVCSVSEKGKILADWDVGLTFSITLKDPFFTPWEIEVVSRPLDTLDTELTGKNHAMQGLAQSLCGPRR